MGAAATGIDIIRFSQGPIVVFRGLRIGPNQLARIDGTSNSCCRNDRLLEPPREPS